LREDKYKNLMKHFHIIFAIIFVFVYVFSIDVLVYGETSSINDLNNEESTYKFELGEKPTDSNYDNYIENKNDKFAYGIMGKSDIFIIVMCILIVAIGMLLLIKNNRKKTHK